MHKKGSYLFVILIIFALFFHTPTAKAQWFEDLENKTGTDAAKIAKQYGWKFVFTPVEAKTPLDFDRLSNIRIDGQHATIYATCAANYRVKDYTNQRVKERATIYDAMEDFDSSPIKIEFEYRPTTNPMMNGIIVRQSIRPGTIIRSGVYEANTPPQQGKYPSFKKPILNQSSPNNSYSSYAPPQKKKIVIQFLAYKMAPVAMPDLTNMTYDDAISKLSRDHVPIIYTQRMEEETKVFSKNNIVFEQNTKPGTIVTKNIMLGLRVYKFKGSTRVPDVLNKSQADATALIKKANLTPKIKHISLSEKYPDKRYYYDVRDLLGKIVEQTPNKDIAVASATEVEITVLKEDEAIMPNVIGMTSAQAEKQIINYRRETIYVYAKTGKDNIISSTEPRAGQTVKTFDTVKVTIERTVPIIPYVIGMTEAQAKAELKKFGLTVSHIKKEPIRSLKTGQVFTIWPVIGTAIRPGTIVTLTLADNEGILFPSVFLKTVEDAIKTLKESGYDNYVIDYKDIDKSNEAYFEAYKNGIGKVESVYPGGPNQVVPQSTQIHLVVPRWAPVEVPLLSSLSEQVAIALLKDKGLLPNITYSTTNLADYNGKVLGGQTPKAYTKVKKGSIVSFTVVAYKISMPTVMHLKEDEAITFLASMGLKTKITYEETEISSRIGSIKAQKPAFREKIDSGGTVELLVYKPSSMVTVPNLINSELNDAIIKVLTEKKLNYTVVDQETVLFLTTPLNKIFKTVPAYLERVAKGSTLTIYRYKKLEKVPNVVGKTEAEATKILEDVGFGVRKYYIANAPAGIVSLQTQIAGSPPRHAAISISIGKLNAPAPMMSMRVSQPSVDDTNKIREFYNRFKEAYESKEESQVVSLISDDWISNDGNSLTDLEDNLRNMFYVFDEIQYGISNLSIQVAQENTFQISYDVAIKGIIYDSDITHNEKSAVQELVKIENGRVQIIKTLYGQFWSVE